jgi:preprotein translocase subunit SecG
MDIVNKVVYALMLLSAVGIIILVLLQHGKGADMGTGFGAGASGSLFGATGSANFLSRSTAFLAVMFFLCTLGLSYLASNRPKLQSNTTDNLPGQIAPQPAQSSGPLPGSLPATKQAPSSAAGAPLSGGDIPK